MHICMPHLLSNEIDYFSVHLMYSLFTLRKARSPLEINWERAFLRVNRLYIYLNLTVMVYAGPLRRAHSNAHMLDYLLCPKNFRSINAFNAGAYLAYVLAENDRVLCIFSVHVVHLSLMVKDMPFSALIYYMYSYSMHQYSCTRMNHQTIWTESVDLTTQSSRISTITEACRSSLIFPSLLLVVARG